jgi:hypothetical protein
MKLMVRKVVMMMDDEPAEEEKEDCEFHAYI